MGLIIENGLVVGVPGCNHAKRNAAANANAANETQDSSKPGNDSGFAASTATATGDTGATRNTGETGEK